MCVCIYWFVCFGTLLRSQKFYCKLYWVMIKKKKNTQILLGIRIGDSKKSTTIEWTKWKWWKMIDFLIVSFTIYGSSSVLAVSIFRHFSFCFSFFFVCVLTRVFTLFLFCPNEFKELHEFKCARRSREIYLFVIQDFDIFAFIHSTVSNQLQFSGAQICVFFCLVCFHYFNLFIYF